MNIIKWNTVLHNKLVFTNLSFTPKYLIVFSLYDRHFDDTEINDILVKYNITGKFYYEGIIMAFDNKFDALKLKLILEELSE